MLISFFNENKMEAGCDEAGRGCLAGPVFAAAVMLPNDFKNPVLNDSKQLGEKDRYLLREVIQKEAIAFAVARVDNLEIDTINILRASFKAMHMAIAALHQRPEFLLIDGNRFIPFENIPYHCIVGGDAKYSSIAAASVLAKTYRDDYMLQLHRQHPEYGWDSNKGYPTKQHRQAIRMCGLTSYHRLSFRQLPEQPELDFNKS
jgi:ribonuclease HII